MMPKRWLGLPLLLLLCACPFAPHSKSFAPQGPVEKELFPRAKRDVFPSDVRADVGAHRSTVLLWTGIILSAEAVHVDARRGLRMVVEHHYWDFIEDYSIQRAIAFLSPRGEGAFEVLFPFEIPPDRVRAGDMAIVYGMPTGLSSDRVLLDGVVLRTLRRELYATDIWDYGRDWLLKRDRADFRILRTPLR